MIDPIQKIFTGVHIDLDRVLAVEQYYDTQIDGENPGLGLLIYMNFMREPLDLSEVINLRGYTEICGIYDKAFDNIPEAKLFFKRVDDLIDLWKRYKMQERENGS